MNKIIYPPEIQNFIDKNADNGVFIKINNYSRYENIYEVEYSYDGRGLRICYLRVIKNQMSDTKLE
jgi:hypothetical protein